VVGTKASNVLNHPLEGFISRDVVFDEAVFPFSELHENASARLRKEILLLPDHLLPRGMDRTDPITANTNVPSCDDKM